MRYFVNIKSFGILLRRAEPDSINTLNQVNGTRHEVILQLRNIQKGQETKMAGGTNKIHPLLRTVGDRVEKSSIEKGTLEKTRKAIILRKLKQTVVK